MGISAAPELSSLFSHKAMQAARDESLAYLAQSGDLDFTSSSKLRNSDKISRDHRTWRIMQQNDEGEKYSLDRLSEESDAPLKPEGDLEAQVAAESKEQQPAPAEYSVSTSRKLVFLGLYFLISLGLTLSNKAVLKRVKLPWLLTVLHTGSTFIGCLAYLSTGNLKLSRLGTKENLILLAFSTLFTLNIAISNVSLSVTANFQNTWSRD